MAAIGKLENSIALPAGLPAVAGSKLKELLGRLILGTVAAVRAGLAEDAGLAGAARTGADVVLDACGRNESRAGRVVTVGAVLGVELHLRRLEFGHELLAEHDGVLVSRDGLLAASRGEQSLVGTSGLKDVLQARRAVVVAARAASDIEELEFVAANIAAGVGLENGGLAPHSPLGGLSLVKECFCIGSVPDIASLESLELLIAHGFVRGLVGGFRALSRVDLLEEFGVSHNCECHALTHAKVLKG